MKVMQDTPVSGDANSAIKLGSSASNKQTGFQSSAEPSNVSPEKMTTHISEF
jgi:hypothetical protein